MRKRILAMFTALVLTLGLFPTAAFATGEHWAQQAVDKLNEIYGVVFTASDEVMTDADAKTILDGMKSSTIVDLTTAGDSIPNLTREKACTILTEIFHIPVGSTSAIQYLYEQNIINGKSESDLDADGTVTKAQFAVLTYRVLNFVGGGMAESTDVLKPGTKEYFAWMYLAARRCVPFAVTSDLLNTTIVSATIQTYVQKAESSDWEYQEKSGQELWNAWVLRLTSLGVSTDDASYSESDTLIAAAMKLVEATGATEIFTDVQPGDWWYDGVMYLFNESIVQGQGDGTFGLQTLPRFQLAILLATLDGAACANETGLSRITGSVNYSIEQGYMTGTKFEGESSWSTEHAEWGNSVYACREDTVVAILKQQEVDVSGVNTSILDRFSDSGDILEDAKPYMAYAVSHGLISGTSTNTLSPDGDVNRPQIGVLTYRILISLDTTKMQDYRENISFVLPVESTEQ